MHQISSGLFDEIFTIVGYYWFHFTLITITMEANGGNVTAAYAAGMAYNGGTAEATLALQD